MFHVILAVIFAIKLFAKSKFHAPKFISSHYGPQALTVLRRLEKAHRGVAKRQADIDFLTKCLLYNIVPKFLRFKLYKSAVQCHRKTRTYRKTLLQLEIKQHQHDIKELEKKIKFFSSALKQQLGPFIWLGVTRFMNACVQQELQVANKTHHQKLCNLGLDCRNLSGVPQVITNLSNYTLSTLETSALNKGLKFNILPTYFDFLQVQASFERLIKKPGIF